MSEAHLCPICKRPLPTGVEERRFRPFCSRRCADVDLGRWLKGAYAIPAVEIDDETEGGDGSPDGETGEEGPRPGRH